MICLDCREAGTLADVLNRSYIAQSRTTTTNALKEQIKALHASCAARDKTWCDCQHRLDGINWFAIKLEAATV